MGQAKISLEDLPIGQTVDHWYMLVPDLNDAENERVDIEGKKFLAGKSKKNVKNCFIFLKHFSIFFDGKIEKIQENL